MTQLSKPYTMIIERDPDEERAWLARAVEDERVHTWGRTVTEAVERSFEVLELWLERDVDRSEVAFMVNDDDAAVKTAEARQRYLQAKAAYQTTLRSAARRLVGDTQLSYRDTATVLDISKGRVSQLVHEDDDGDDSVLGGVGS
jgi:predicted RNase H-like HicB family nuclease/predicted XRE-type DNA-binding protein